MGFNANEIYAAESDWLKASDLQKQKHEVVIEKVDLAEFTKDGQKQRKLQISFVNKTKSLLVNKTNADTISYIHGPDTDAWIGQTIILYPTMVSFGNERVEAIRVEMPMQMAPSNQASPQSFQQAVSTTAVDDQHAPDVGDDLEDLPF